jgi:hypothetical protein
LISGSKATGRQDLTCANAEVGKARTIVIANIRVGGDGRNLFMWLFPFKLLTVDVPCPVKPALETLDSDITAQPSVTAFRSSPMPLLPIAARI